MGMESLRNEAIIALRAMRMAKLFDKLAFEKWRHTLKNNPRRFRREGNTPENFVLAHVGLLVTVYPEFFRRLDWNLDELDHYANTAPLDPAATVPFDVKDIYYSAAEWDVLVKRLDL